MLIDIWQGEGSAAALIGGRNAEARARAFVAVVKRETKADTWCYQDAASKPKQVWAVEALGIGKERLMKLWLAEYEPVKVGEGEPPVPWEQIDSEHNARARKR